jgi:hypothetical protein
MGTRFPYIGPVQYTKLLSSVRELAEEYQDFLDFLIAVCFPGHRYDNCAYIRAFPVAQSGI